VDPQLIEKLADWGYYPLPKSHSHSPGCSGLLIAIRSEPTEEHFDPESIQLCLESGRGVSEEYELTLSLPEGETGRVCPSRITLRDRVNERVDFFTFGGMLEVTTQPGEALYAFHSPAPILELEGFEETLADQLASEAELWLGEMEAQWRLNEEGFNRRLAEVEPLQFYSAVLTSTLHKFEESEALQDTFPEFYEMLQQERDWMSRQEQWPDEPSPVEKLLAPEAEGDAGKDG
jgi:hypothetical protein